MSKVIQLKNNNGDNLYPNVLDLIYPVGTIYETTSDAFNTPVKMNNHFGGTWEKYGNGRVTVCQTSTSTNFNTIGKTGGAETHTLTVEQMPSHQHQLTLEAYGTDTASGVKWSAGAGMGKFKYAGDMIEPTGGGGSHNNIQPYIVVYRYRRIS